MIEAAQNQVNPWVSAGMADFLAFDRNGMITHAATTHLQGMAIGDNIFARLPVLSGFEDIFSDPDIVARPVVLDGVVLGDQAKGQPMDFSVGLSADTTLGLVLITPNFSHGGPVADRLRSKRKQAYLDDLLAQERARFEQIYRQSPVSAFALASDGSVTATSDQFQDWLGPDIDSERWIKDFCRTHRHHWQHPHRQGTETVSIRSAVSLCAARIVIVDISVFVLEGQGDDEETYVALQDVTAATAMMATLSRQRAEIEAAAGALTTSNRRLEQFAHVAAHDLLGPLGRMSSFSDIIELELGGKAQGIVATAVDAIRISARESIDLVHDLLTLAKLQYFEPDYEEINIINCITDLKNGLLRDLDITLEFDGPATLVADRRLFELIVRNLVSNSYKYRNPDRPLVVRFGLTQSATGSLTLSIVDNGSGFDGDGVDPFAAFERMREHSDAQGAGLGLAMVKDSAETMGWSAGITSQRGEGTTLLFTGISNACA